MDGAAGAIQASSWRRWLGIQSEGYDGHGGHWWSADHPDLLGPAAHCGTQGHGWPAQEEEAEVQHERGRVLLLPGQVTLHQRFGYPGQSTSLTLIST